MSSSPTTSADFPRPPVIPSILEEHLNELDFLWEQRERFVLSPEWTLKELAVIEARAEAHLDGLRIGAGHSVDLARPALVAAEAGLVTAATFVLMTFGQEHEVLQTLRTAPPKGRDGIRVGLRHCDPKGIAAELSELAASAEPAIRAVALDVMAFHRLAPPGHIAGLYGDPDPCVRRLAYEAAGRIGGPWDIDLLTNALESDDPSVRLAALRTSARVGIPDLDAACRDLATRSENPIPEALAFLGVVGDPRDLGTLLAAIARPSLSGAALDGIGTLGLVAAIPALIEVMSDQRLAHAAGRAFVRITGANGIEATQPIPPPAMLAEDALDTWDESLPPDPEKVRAWWQRGRDHFTAQARWQAGCEVSKGPLGEYFNALPLATRLDLYLGARALDPQRIPDRELECRAVDQLGKAGKAARH